MYTEQIIWFLAIPALIYLSYLLSFRAIRKFEKRLEEKDRGNSQTNGEQ